MPPSEKTATYERGTYYFFDVNNWRLGAQSDEKILILLTKVTLNEVPTEIEVVT